MKSYNFSYQVLGQALNTHLNTTNATINYDKSIIFHRANSMLAVVNDNEREYLVTIKNNSFNSYSFDTIRQDELKRIIKLDFNPKTNLLDIYEAYEQESATKYSVSVNPSGINDRVWLQDGLNDGFREHEKNQLESVYNITGHADVNLDRKVFESMREQLNGANPQLTIRPCWNISEHSEVDMYIMQQSKNEKKVIKTNTHFDFEDMTTKLYHDNKLIISNSILSQFDEVILPSGVFDKYVPILTKKGGIVSLLYYDAEGNESDKFEKEAILSDNGSVVCGVVIEEAGHILSIVIVNDNGQKKLVVNDKEKYINSIRDEDIKNVLLNTTEIKHLLFHVDTKSAQIEFAGHGLSMVFEGPEDFNEHFLNKISQELDNVLVIVDEVESDDENEDEDGEILIVLDEENPAQTTTTTENSENNINFFSYPSAPMQESTFKETTEKDINDFCQMVKSMVFNPIIADASLFPVNLMEITSNIEESKVNSEKMDNFFGGQYQDKKGNFREIKGVLPNLLRKNNNFIEILKSSREADIYQLQYILALFIRGSFEQKEGKDSLHFPLLDARNLRGFLHKNSKYKPNSESERYIQRAIDLSQGKDGLTLQGLLGEAKNNQQAFIDSVGNHCKGITNAALLPDTARTSIYSIY